MMEQLTALKQQLIGLQHELAQKLERIKSRVTTPGHSDWSEQAQERENDEVIDALGNEVRRELQLVNLALFRMKEGDYQYCSDCGENINIERLKVLPYTQLCITCAHKKDS